MRLRKALGVTAFVAVHALAFVGGWWILDKWVIR